MLLLPICISVREPHLQLEEIHDDDKIDPPKNETDKMMTYFTNETDLTFKVSPSQDQHTIHLKNGRLA